MGILRTDKISGLETPTAVTGSVVFDGSGDYLSLASSSDFAWGTGDFTWETWVYSTASDHTTGNHYIFDLGGGNIAAMSFYQNKFNYYNTTIGLNGQLGTFSANRWTHLAVSRKNQVSYIFVDGILQGSISDTHNYGTTALVAKVGVYAANNTLGWEGHISNLRILKGTALYINNFTPPTRELQPIGDTVLLCCNNPDSVTAASYAGIGTSVTLTANGNVSVASTVPGLTRDFTFGTQFEGVAKFDTQGYFVPPSGTTEQRSRGRGIIFGGYTSPSSVNNIQYVSIQSTGTAQDFGDLTVAASISGAVSSSTRGISAGGFVTPSPATYSQTIDYVTIATTGNAIKFGDLQGQRGYIAGFSNSTRGIFVSGYKQTPSPAGTTGETDYITIASLGNTQDFGTATFGYYQDAGCSSSTRGLVAGVNNPSGPGHTANIQYVTIATTGNTQTFGDLTQFRRGLSATSSSTRAVFCGGYTGPASHFNIIDYVTIATTGNAQDFGDAVFAGAYRGATSNSIRGVFINGYTPSLVNHIDYITISTTGNALDFGDSLITASSPSGASDSHGGLS